MMRSVPGARVVAGVAAGLFCGALLASGSLAQTQGSAASDAQALTIEQLSCSVEPSRRVSVASATTGVARHVGFERGDAVRSGALLLELNSDLERTQLSLATTRADFLRRRLARNREMVAQNLISAHERDELATELRMAELEQARARIEVERRKTSSPVDGVVVERRVEEGEFVTSSPFAEIVVLHPLHAEIVFRAGAYGLVRPGMVAELDLSIPDGERRQARIVAVDRVIDAASITFRARAVIDNADGRLPAGMNCRTISLRDQADRP
jgi:RND family efflux transporter MFP subunit